MATRPCLRCSKLVPAEATFCRRCGSALAAAGERPVARARARAVPRAAVAARTPPANAPVSPPAFTPVGFPSPTVPPVRPIPRPAFMHTDVPSPTLPARPTFGRSTSAGSGKGRARPRWVLLVAVLIGIRVVSTLSTLSSRQATPPPLSNPYEVERGLPGTTYDRPWRVGHGAEDDSAVAAAGRRLAESAARVEAARQRLQSARQRFDWRTRPDSAGEASRQDSPLIDPLPDPVAAPPSPDPVAPQPARPGSTPPAPPMTRRLGTLAAVARANVLRTGAPQIAAFSAGRARAGRSVVIEGSGLAGADRVLFAAAGGSGAVDAGHAGWREAPFRVRDDGHIAATVPDLGRDEREVVVAVVTPAGAAVTVPAAATLVAPGRPDLGRHANGEPASVAGDAGRFYFVAAGGTLSPARGATVFVDAGGAVRAPAGSLVFVRSGGRVAQARADCLIIRETPRPERRDLSTVPVLDVRALNACFVDSAFHYAGR